MISLSAFRDQILNLFEKRFPGVDFAISERRSAILEIRVIFAHETFMEIYANAVTGKKSFTVIKNGKRIWGYDNYRYWHHHPLDKPESHVPCNEPSLNKIVDELRTVLTKIKCLSRDTD